MALVRKGEARKERVAPLINEDVGLRKFRQVSPEITTKVVAYASQVCVDHLVRMKMVKATRDAKQLSLGYENRPPDHWKAEELTRRMRSTR
jgi:hypothetical protein